MSEIINMEKATPAVSDDAENGCVVTVKLSKPFKYEGKSYEELSFDFEALTGADDLDIERELRAKGENAFVPALSGEYLIRMCARACTAEIGHDALLYMPLKDENRIKAEARNFLLRSEQ